MPLMFLPMRYYREKLKRSSPRTLQCPVCENIGETYLLFLLFCRPAFLKEAENFTILVKNNIWYPKFNFSK